jgi:DNA transposition AAA+ family ATPase
MEDVERHHRRIKNVKHVQTTVAQKIGSMIKTVASFSADDEEGCIGLLIGDDGHGKRHCLRQYAEVNKNTVYVELDDTMSSTVVFQEIARALSEKKEKGLRIDSYGFLSAVARRISDVLRPRHIIVLIDEASNLTVEQLNQLRQIVVVRGRCPLILAGNQDLWKTVNQETKRPGYESLDQFTSRMLQVLNLDELAESSGGGSGVRKTVCSG